MIRRIHIQGAGRAGHALAGALRASGLVVDGPAGRPAPGAAPEVGDADVILVAVGDRDLTDAIEQLRGARLAAGAVVLHTSGGTDPANALDALRALGHPAGTFHPLVPLTGEEGAAQVLRGAWIGVDGDPAAIETGRALAGALGGHPFVIPAGSKPRYHAAAVMASNFPTVLAELAIRQMRIAGLDADAARGAVNALLSAAITNMQTLDPPRALTGPVSRGDAPTIARHVAVLDDTPDTLAVYVALTRAALDIAPTIDRKRAAEIRAVLEADEGI
jgi:predicted short-subunit dehydrogenase-like oxidoreductase (DUF2520 family)